MRSLNPSAARPHFEHNLPRQASSVTTTLFQTQIQSPSAFAVNTKLGASAEDAAVEAIDEMMGEFEGDADDDDSGSLFGDEYQQTEVSGVGGGRPWAAVWQRVPADRGGGVVRGTDAQGDGLINCKEVERGVVRAMGSDRRNSEQVGEDIMVLQGEGGKNKRGSKGDWNNPESVCERIRGPPCGNGRETVEKRKEGR